MSSPSPKVWLISSATSPLGYSIALQALQNGDSVALGCRRNEVASDPAFLNPPPVPPSISKSANEDDSSKTDQHGDPVDPALDDSLHTSISLSRLCAAFPSTAIIVELDARSIPLCQSSLSQTVAAFGHIDVVLIGVASARTYVGCVEEISPASAAAQFEEVTFASVNMVRMAIPVLRRQRRGHLVVVTGVTGSMGTPALGVRCAADWAVEGFCDACAYEVAPFGIRMSVVQPPVEVLVLSNNLSIAQTIPAYTPAGAPPPKDDEDATTEPTPVTTMRNMISSLLRSHPGDNPAALHPALAETVHVIMSISGLDDPPGRVVVGNENAEQVKERLKAVSEELEDYLEASTGVDATGQVSLPTSVDVLGRAGSVAEAS